MPVNQIILRGNLVKEPELRKVGQQSKSVCNFRLATTERFGEREESQFHNCVAWEKTADTIYKWCKKGTHVDIVGKLTHRSYDDDHGNKKYVTEVKVLSVDFIANAKTKEEVTGQPAAAPAQQPAPQQGVDDLDVNI